MFCLAATEQLSYELQRKCAETMEISMARMREVEEHKEMDPIVVVTGQSEKQHLLAQFGDLRRKYVPRRGPQRTQGQRRRCIVRRLAGCT